MNHSIEPVFWDLTELGNSVDYLEHGVRALLDAERNHWSWKWVCIGLHGALYGFAVCAVQGTDYTRVTKRNNKGQHRLKSFDEILDMCQNPTWMIQYVHSKVLKLTPSQKRSIALLKNTLRNNLEHYIPKRWAIELHGMPEVVIDVLDVIAFLALESGNLLGRMEPYEQARIRALIQAGQEFARSMKLHHEATAE